MSQDTNPELEKAASEAASNAPSPIFSRYDRPYTLDRVVRLVISLLALALGVWLIDRLKLVLLPFLVAWLVAYMLEPFVQYNQRLLGVRRRWIPVFMTLFETILILSLAIMLLMPSLAREAAQMSVLISKYAGQQSSIPFVPESVHSFLRKYIDFEFIAQQLRSQDIDTWLSAIGSVLSGGYNMVLWAINWFFTLLYIVFIMLDYERLNTGFKRMVPPKYRKVVYRVGHDVKDSMNHYFRGQALVALCVGILFAIGLSIVGLPLAVALGLFIGLLNMVPYLQLISIIPSALLCLVYSMDSHVDFWPVFGATMLVYVIVQCIQDLVLTPRIMGSAMGLNPAIILLSLSVWGTLLGFIGLIIALPLTTLLLAYYNMYIISREDGGTNAQRRQASRALRRMTSAPKL